MKKLTIVLLIVVVLLALVCLFQQLEIMALADEINNLNEFVGNQIKLNDNFVDIFEEIIAKR